MKLSILLNRGADSNYDHGNETFEGKIETFEGKLETLRHIGQFKPKTLPCVHVADAEPSDAAAAARRRQQRSLVDARRGYLNQASTHMKFFLSCVTIV